MASNASVGAIELGRRLYYLSKRCIILPRKHITVTLSDLPLELLVQILLLLEWNEVLRARQTCRHLRDASLARPVWLALVKLYSTTVIPRPFCLDKPSEFYTDRELELLVLRWQKSRVCWPPSQSKAVPILRQFISPEKERNCVHLVEGGRWLLVGINSGSVLCYDLEASVVEPTTLIPAPFDEDTALDRDRENEIRLSVDMDLEAEYLKFNLGIITQHMPESKPDPSSRPPRFFRWIQVWQVESDVDKNGVAKGLRAERLACFPEQHQNRCDAFRLRGRHVAYALDTPTKYAVYHNKPCIVIVNWTLCDSASLIYPRKVVWMVISHWLALLPENKLLSHYYLNFVIFDLDGLPMTTLDPSKFNLHLTPTGANAKLLLSANAISEPVFFRNSTRISVLTILGVRGLTIPHSNGISGSIIERVDILSRPYANIGNEFIWYDRALISCWPRLVFLQYAWPEDGPCNLVDDKTIDQTTCEAGDFCNPKVLFDKSSGRIVLSDRDTKKKLVLRLDNL